MVVEDFKHIVFQLVTVQTLEFSFFIGGLLHVFITVFSSVFDFIHDGSEFMSGLATLLHLLRLTCFQV
jgi:hypothetical protein